MRKTATWMRQVDERVLEHLNEAGESNPMLMAEHPRFEDMGASAGQLRERCECLAEAGMIATTGNGWFDITTWGQQYLEGDLDARNQPRPRRVL